MLFGQTFAPSDIATIGLLIVLEGVLSIDNALVLGILAKRLPKKLQSRALTYGLVGAFVFRLIAIGTATFLLKWHIVKLLGGAYLIYIAIKHFFFESHDEEKHDHIATDEEKEAALEPGVKVLAYEHPSQAAIKAVAKFWPTVLVIELTDIAFAVDSILAAIGVVGGPSTEHRGVDAVHDKLWVILTGGMLGVILMRYAAVLFIKLLERFPRFETAAYLLVIAIGAKLLVDWGFNSEQHHRVNFHDSGSIAFWIFWVVMVACFSVGFLPAREKPQHEGAD